MGDFYVSTGVVDIFLQYILYHKTWLFSRLVVL